MLIIDGCFQNNIFVPDYKVSLPDGTKATVTIEESETKNNLKVSQQKKAWHDFFEGIRNSDENLPVEFDEIIKKGLVFNHTDFS